MGRELPTDVQRHPALDTEPASDILGFTEEVSRLNSERDLMWHELSVLRPWYTVDQKRTETDPAVLQLLQRLDAIGERIETHWRENLRV